MYTLHVLVVEAADITKLDANYTGVCCSVQTNTETKETLIVPHNMYPRWNQDFHFNIVTPNVGSLHITIRNKDPYKKDMNISYVDIQYASLPLGQVVDQWYNCSPFDRDQVGGRVHLVLQMATVNSPPFVPTVTQTAFPMQQTVYQTPGYPVQQNGYPVNQQGYMTNQLGYPNQIPQIGYPQNGYVAAPPPPGYPSYGPRPPY